MLSSLPSSRKRHVALTAGVKLQIADKLRDGASRNSLAELNKIDETTVTKIKKAAPAILFKIQNSHGVNVLNKKRFRSSPTDRTRKVVIKLVENARAAQIPVTDDWIQALARKVHYKLHPELDPNSRNAFKASNGWLYNFKKDYGLRSVKITGESASADLQAAADFIPRLNELIKDYGYLKDEIYNADETALYYKGLPTKTLVLPEGDDAKGKKMQKQRVTLLFCANWSGSHCLKVCFLPILLY